ncbi:MULTISPECIES: Crp/Fnr family transcriptional regulator [unclassified Leeuwenhoekiella]|uniref:Crp/Fnr family transcriptional regulator n=1 Tax=unclassified Leeuwenhoekiella TaxID=2615029 RepID=UPI000C3E7144|nr:MULTISPECIES: Crp/Fnr family transcriptional regulator [unclassified Leeuwenhoekiella]MAW95203.1 Crp/Fnr family transcriptional regulator [Leeuwenhoekiella sp.]MBA81874.1 Crp/Fnr family transcriptional regulator [Leeuwenhoekiella sp.]|tara:strand:+ start:32585 stop:33220 length:636 start_codon:yes stop_codon:yes gene_type:complete
MEELLQLHYGHLFEPELLNEILEAGSLREVNEGDKLMEIGQYITAMPLLISGAIKILREDPDGDELLLYFLEKGDTCALTLSFNRGQRKSEIRAIAELDTVLIMVPIQKMEEWSSKYKTWRNFIFDSYQNRLQEMLDTLDSIAFMRMDERLLRYLRDKQKLTQSDELNSTHQDIAYELHTSRVVISRLLKKLELEGRINIQRNKIQLLDLD